MRCMADIPSIEIEALGGKYDAIERILHERCPSTKEMQAGAEKPGVTRAFAIAVSIVSAWTKGPLMQGFWHGTGERKKLDRLEELAREFADTYSSLHPELQIALEDKYSSAITGQEWSMTESPWLFDRLLNSLEWHIGGRAHIASKRDGDIVARPGADVPNQDSIIDQVKKIDPIERGTLKKRGARWRRIMVCDVVRRLWASETGQFVNSIPEWGSEFGDMLNAIFSALTGGAVSPSMSRAAMDDWRKTLGGSSQPDHATG